ncbi:MAG: hypothetical protein WD824_27115, partial [Cyclobacteriaceae bacterium]
KNRKKSASPIVFQHRSWWTESAVSGMGFSPNYSSIGEANVGDHISTGEQKEISRGRQCIWLVPGFYS